jgi:hypothetical protein
LTVGSVDVFANHFASGWSAKDHDGDVYAPDNWSTAYASIAQHDGACRIYSLSKRIARRSAISVAARHPAPFARVDTCGDTRKRISGPAAG